jgi:hypothetical protein
VEIYAFLIIGGMWAAFLLPGIFESRRRAPLNTTRNFSRSKDLLASVSGVNAGEVKARRRLAARRRRVLTVLAAAAFVSLAGAVAQSSLLWLTVTIGFDVVLAAYVTLMLQVKAGVGRSATVVPLIAVEPEGEDKQHHTVRVVAN